MQKGCPSLLDLQNLLLHLETSVATATVPEPHAISVRLFKSGRTSSSFEYLTSLDHVRSLDELVSKAHMCWEGRL